MSGTSLLGLVPSDFVEESRDSLEEMLDFPSNVVEMIKDEPRTVVWKALLPSGARAVVKTYRKRSLYDFCRESLTRFRVQREFDSLNFLTNNDIPSARSICWAYGRDAVFGRFETLVTFEEPHVVGLRQHLSSKQADDRWIEPAARLVRQGHEQGFYHGALAPRNVLVRLVEGQAACCIYIDTARSIVFPRPITGTRMAQHDLVLLLDGVYRIAGESLLARFLNTYGVPAPQIPRLIDKVKRYRGSRNARNRARTEFLIRRLFS